jgi:mRNA-degrading endonuclease HigB of HigAB toxin-antitoxin module
VTNAAVRKLGPNHTVPTHQMASDAGRSDRLLANIQYAFKEFGVQIMSTHYEFDPERQTTVPSDR